MVQRCHQLDLVAVAVWRPVTEASMKRLAESALRREGDALMKASGSRQNKVCRPVFRDEESAPLATPSSGHETQGRLKSLCQL